MKRESQTQEGDMSTEDVFQRSSILSAPGDDWNHRIQRLARGMNAAELPDLTERIRRYPQFNNPGSLFYFAIHGDDENGLNIEETASAFGTLAGRLDYLDTELDQKERQVEKLEKEKEILRNDKAILRKKLDESRRREQGREMEYCKSTVELNSLRVKIGRLFMEAKGSVEEAKTSSKTSAEPFESEAPTHKTFSANDAGRTPSHQTSAHDSDDEDTDEQGDLGDLAPSWRPSVKPGMDPSRSQRKSSRGSISNQTTETAGHVVTRGASQRTPRPLSDAEGDSSAPQRKRFRKD